MVLGIIGLSQFQHEAELWRTRDIQAKISPNDD